jgi:hypothetical protein
VNAGLLVVLGIAAILTALGLGRSHLRRKRDAAEAAVRAQHAERQREIHAWLTRDRAQRVRQVLREPG